VIPAGCKKPRHLMRGRGVFHGSGSRFVRQGFCSSQLRCIRIDVHILQLDFQGRLGDTGGHLSVVLGVVIVTGVRIQQLLLTLVALNYVCVLSEISAANSAR
jgi:hypothetical protein